MFSLKNIMLFKSLLLLFAVFSTLECGRPVLDTACSEIFDWSPTALYGGGVFDKVYDGSYMICGDKIKCWASVQATIGAGDSVVIAINPPVGQVGPLPSSTEWEFINHGYGDGINIEGTTINRVDLFPMTNTTCISSAGLSPLNSDVIEIYVVDGGSAPRTFEASLSFEYTNLNGATC